MSGAPLGVIAGSGAAAVEVANAARAAGREVFVAALSGSASLDDFTGLEGAVFGVGQFGALCASLRERRISDVLFIGGVVRPGVADVKPDFGMLKHWRKVLDAFRKGDDGLLSGIIAIFESEGFRVLDPLGVAPALAAERPGPLGRHRAKPDAIAEMEEARAVIRALSPFDVGQAVIVADGRPVAIEGAEGTDGLLARVAEMRRMGRLPRDGGGVLVKAPRTGRTCASTCRPSARRPSGARRRRASPASA